ncbi:MAG: ATP-binding protein [Cytophagaceae bacterium]
MKDNGLCIDLAKHGDKLFKLHKTFHEHPQAKGFGLYITKTQIESLGGTISAKSLPKQGSIFTARLYNKNNHE